VDCKHRYETCLSVLATSPQNSDCRIIMINDLRADACVLHWKCFTPSGQIRSMLGQIWSVSVRFCHCKRYRATGPHRATGPESTWTWIHPQTALWDIPPNPATLCDRSAQGSKSWHSGLFAKYSDIGFVTISFPACCVSHRATGLPVMVHDMHTRRRRPDYLQACPTGPPVDGVKSTLTPALYLIHSFIKIV